jgi:hypothetical protein
MNNRRIGNTSAGTLRINSLDVHDINRALTAIGMRLDNLQGIGQVPIHPASSGTKTTGSATSTGSSTTAKAASTAAAASVPPAHPPTPTGLQTELGNTTYRGRDLELTWDDVRNPELYEFTANERFRDYLVEARTNAGAKLREVAVASEKFVYTRDQMVKDGLTDRSFTVRIWARDLDGNLSDAPGKITVSKEVPTLAGQAPLITATSKGIDVDLSGLAHNAENVDQWKILIDTVNPPVAVARLVPEKTKHVFWPKEVNITTAHYVRVIPVDYFGDGTASDVASDSIAPLFESAGGAVRIDDDGISLPALGSGSATGKDAFKFVSGSTVKAWWATLDYGSLTQSSIEVFASVNRHAIAELHAKANTTGSSSAAISQLKATGNNSIKTSTVIASVTTGNVAQVNLTADEVFVNAGPDTIDISKMAALTATVSGSIGATYTAFEQSVLVNLRTRLAELETRMQGKGWLA